MVNYRLPIDRYLKEAEALRQTAQSARDEEVRAHLLTTARLYEQLAATVAGTRPVRRKRAAAAR